MSAILLTADLLCSSQVAGAAARAGVAISTAMNVTALLEQAEGKKLAVLDLAMPELNVGGLDVTVLLPRLRERSPGIRIVAFGPHVKEDLLQHAQQAGCDAVLTRGQFHMQTEEVLRWAL